ncbi:PAB-dependent poly(A)-specific ribonuclease subunit 3 [Geosmithia morbida]|uniref:PAN2-PAN3 deadenylation complex subunit PAN3 n=1 Tax=Geosmithia morbida TaxID=1094350 RepID=A0A9P4YNV4_9HYPO|nr:PAB-dependent poly(A)-specific ribonuclease subunit 3 [Geosmithia morbida]KAF4119877.1 PAB-dependent poly(A)-specific ribonuclease subunit 3 [Geosmithia morbida]
MADSPPLSPRSRKTLNVESPSFTPATQVSSTKKATIPTQAANAPSFTPRGLGAATPTGVSTGSAQEPDPSIFNPAAIREFTPSFDLHSAVASPNGAAQDGTVYSDAFVMANVGSALPTPQYNPYAEDHSGMAGAAHSTSFFQPQSAFTGPLQPLQHHLYAPSTGRRDDLHPYQRTTSDFFMPEELRQELVKKLEATNQTMPNSQLPQLDNFHSLVPLDTTHRKNPSVFGYTSWIYKAFSVKNGRAYSLRRLEGYRLSNENSIRSVKEWRRVVNTNVVMIHDAFTTRAFGDSSLIFVQDFHPLAKTLAEVHLAPSPVQGNRFQQKAPIVESLLWSYISQIASTLKEIHGNNLAARCLDVSKILVTDKGHLRLSACSILDVVQYEARRPVQELQQEDLINFGRLMLGLATNTHPAHLNNLQTALDQLNRTYSAELRDSIIWLLTPQQPPQQKGIEEFLRGIAIRLASCYEEEQQKSDETNSVLLQAVENGRTARLLLKLAAINERPDFNGDQSWSENGGRYLLKLFRDYAFHQVDRDGNPVLDIGHMIRCMNKLDAGTEEQVLLTSRDEQTTFLVTYKELRKQLNAAFGELQKAASKQPGPGRPL